MLRALTLTLLVALLASGQVVAQESYDSLEDFCLRTNADTPENCACGQATADRIMSDAEQATVLSMMANQQPPPADPQERMALMQKVNQMTEGCGDQDSG